MSLGLTLVPLALVLVLIIAMLLTAHVGMDRGAHRLPAVARILPLAPLITAIGMSIILQNFIQVAQGARVKPLPPVVTGGYQIFDEGGFAVNLSNIQILIVVHDRRADGRILAGHHPYRAWPVRSAPASRTG